MDKNKEIFTKNFSGNIDDLLNHCSNNADFVENVLSGTEDIMVTNTEALAMIKEDFPNISDEFAKKILEEIQLEMFQDVINDLIKKGMLQITKYDDDGTPLYGPTELGRSVMAELKKNESKV